MYLGFSPFNYSQFGRRCKQRGAEAPRDFTASLRNATILLTPPGMEAWARKARAHASIPGYFPGVPSALALSVHSNLHNIKLLVQARRNPEPGEGSVGGPFCGRERSGKPVCFRA